MAHGIVRQTRKANRSVDALTVAIMETKLTEQRIALARKRSRQRWVKVEEWLVKEFGMSSFEAVRINVAFQAAYLGVEVPR